MKRLKSLFFISALILALIISAQEEYKSIELNGITLVYRDIGKGEPLGSLHGFATNEKFGILLQVNLQIIV